MDLEFKRKYEKEHPGETYVSDKNLDIPQTPYMYWHEAFVICPNCNQLIVYEDKKCYECGQSIIYPGHPDYERISNEQREIDKKYQWGKYDPNRQWPPLDKK